MDSRFKLDRNEYIDYSDSDENIIEKLISNTKNIIYFFKSRRDHKSYKLLIEEFKSILEYELDRYLIDKWGPPPPPPSLPPIPLYKSSD
jgi:hypothetical protein